MEEKLIAWVVARKWVFLLLAILTIMLFLANAGNLRYQLFPELEDPVLVAEFELRPGLNFLEDYAPGLISTLQAVPGTSYVTAGVNGKRCRLIVESGTGLSPEVILLQLQEALDKYLAGGPEFTQNHPLFVPRMRHNIPILEIHVATVEISSAIDWVNNILTARLALIEGVGRITISGSPERSIAFSPDPRLAHDALKNADFISNLTTTKLLTSRSDFDLYYHGIDLTQSLAMEYTPGVKSIDMWNVYPHENYDVRILRNGQPAVVLEVYQQPGSNARLISDSILKLVEQTNDKQPGLGLSVFNNRVEAVDLTLQNIVWAIGAALLVCSMLVYMFFRSFRFLLWLSLVVLSSVSSLGLLWYLFEFSFDLISLSGVVIGIGLLIDNPIIIGEAYLRGSMEGILRTSKPIVISNISTLLVFVPLLFYSELNLRLFGGMSLAIAMLLFLSLLFSWILVPWLKIKSRPFKWSSSSRGEYVFNRYKLIIFLALPIVAGCVFTVKSTKCEWIPSVRTSVWKSSDTSSLVKAGGRSNIKAIVHKKEANGEEAFIEFDKPVLLRNSSFVAAGDPFQELIRSLESVPKWYRPEGLNERLEWDGYETINKLSWRVDLPASSELPEQLQVTNQYRNQGVTWFNSIPEKEIVNEFIPFLKPQTGFVYVDHAGTYKMRPGHAGSLSANSGNTDLTFLLSKLMLIALILLFILLIFFYRSWTEVLIMIGSLPTCMAGSIFFLWLTGYSLNLFSISALIFTFGVSLNDAILKVDGLRIYLKNGHCFSDALRLTCKNRLRPVLLTSLTTLGSCVALLGASYGLDDINSSVAVAIIGGILFATAYAVWVLPSLLLLCDNLQPYRIVHPTD